MMSNINNAAKPSSPIASRKKYPAPQRPSIEELKRKYEAQVNQKPIKLQPETPKNPQVSTPKALKKSKVKQMASMFNSKISQIIRREPESNKYSSLVNELSPEPNNQPKTELPKPLPLPKIRYNKEKAPLPSPRTKSKARAQQKSIYFVSEDNFATLTVKDKAQLYTQFIDDMSRKNPKFGKHAELMEANVKKVVARGEVVNEKQESVKQLLEELEARCTFPKQTVSPLALQRINSLKGDFKKSKSSNKGPVKSKEFEDILEKKVSHITTLTITLQSCEEVKKHRRARSLPRRRCDHEEVLKDLGIIEPSHKRNNGEMRSSLPIEAYAPPKKIRRTRAEKLTPQIVFQNQQLENLFFTWLKERQDKVEDTEVKKCSEEEMKPKSAIDKLLEEAIAKLETVESKQKEQMVVEEKEIDTKAKSYNKKKPAPPVPKQTKQMSVIRSEASASSSAKHSEVEEESEFCLTSLNKLNSEVSPSDTPAKESDAEFGKPIKPLRKKKMRRTLTWKKDTSLEETQPITSTDSDSDYKIAQTKNKNKMLFLQNDTEEEQTTPNANEETMAEPTYVELDTTLMREVNSPRKIKSAYTLTAFSPTPCQQEEETVELNTTACIKLETSSSWPSLVVNQIDEDLSLAEKALSTDFTLNQTLNENRTLADSFIDQGFETGSNDMDSPIRAPRKSNLKRQNAKVSAPLFLKLASSETANDLNESPSGFSTPIKGHLQQPAPANSSSAQQQLFSPINMPMKNRRRSIYDSESRRNSLAMQVIREDHPLEQHEITTSPRNLSNSEHVFFANAPTLDITNEVSTAHNEKTSQFWIKCGDFAVSLDIFHNDNERVRLLYEIFSQRSCETKDLHFGIDNQKFSVHNPLEQEDNITRKLPQIKDCSQYWFSTGDLAIPFSGKRLTSEKIQRLFAFIKASVEETGILRFGVDSVEFSNVPEFWNQSPKFSMESNYSMLVGLQSGNSNGLEGRSKFAWPNTKPLRVSDLDQSDYECEDFEDNDSCRLSFSPFGSNHFDLAALGNVELSLPRNSEAMMNGESFGYEYENESLDQLFEDKYETTKSAPSTETQLEPVPIMLNTLKTQQERLSLVQEKLSTYSNPANLSSDALDALQGTPEYLEKLKEIVAEITAKGNDSGFKNCSVQELESYMFFLSRYADICLHSCSDHMEKVLDALLDQRAVLV